jgi:tetratricopeptide (TPR) repeat protein
VKGIGRDYNVSAAQVSTGTGQLVIASSKPDEVSWEGTGYPNSVFTKRLIECLQVSGQKTKLGTAYNALKEKVQEEVLRDRGVMQTPEMKSKWEGNDLILAVKPVSPRPAFESAYSLSNSANDSAKACLTEGGPASSMNMVASGAGGQAAGFTAGSDGGGLQAASRSNFSGSAQGNAGTNSGAASDRSASGTVSDANGRTPLIAMSTPHMPKLPSSIPNVGTISQPEQNSTRVHSSISTSNPLIAVPPKHLLECGLFVPPQILLFHKQFAESEAKFKQLLEMAERRKWPADELVTILNFYGDCYRDQGNAKEAEAIYQRALKLGEQSLTETNPYLAQTVDRLQFLYWNQQNYAAAEPLLKRLLFIMESYVGKSDPDLTAKLDELAYSERQLGKLDDALDAEERSAAIKNSK